MGSGCGYSRTFFPQFPLCLVIVSLSLIAFPLCWAQELGTDLAAIGILGVIFGSEVAVGFGTLSAPLCVTLVLCHAQRGQ